MNKYVVTAWALIFVLIPRDAWAYLDPGTGSLLLQAAAASIFAGMLTIKLYWQRLVAFVSARSRTGSADVSENLAAGAEDDG
jgi:hypothetical protein